MEKTKEKNTEKIYIIVRAVFGRIPSRKGARNDL